MSCVGNANYEPSGTAAQSNTSREQVLLACAAWHALWHSESAALGACSAAATPNKERPSSISGAQHMRRFSRFGFRLSVQASAWWLTQIRLPIGTWLHSPAPDRTPVCLQIVHDFDCATRKPAASFMQSLHFSCECRVMNR